MEDSYVYTLENCDVSGDLDSCNRPKGLGLPFVLHESAGLGLVLALLLGGVSGEVSGDIRGAG